MIKGSGSGRLKNMLLDDRRIRIWAGQKYVDPVDPDSDPDSDPDLEH
jgi:hypothetical protein